MRSMATSSTSSCQPAYGSAAYANERLDLPAAQVLAQAILDEMEAG
ncbi:MAG: hypothetical protein IPL61_09560 [Myxococcales bacterium]|nr:hypothetical protein [Myxococcales bacterium]